MSRWLMNLPVDPRKHKQFASWVASRGDDMDNWALMLAATTVGKAIAQSETAKHYDDRGWVGLYTDAPEKRKGSYEVSEPVRIKGDGI